MKQAVDFGQGGFLAFWDSMSPDERYTLVGNLEEFHASVASLKGQELIEVNKLGNEVTILKSGKAVTEFLKFLKTFTPPGIKIIDNRKKIKGGE